MNKIKIHDLPTSPVSDNTGRKRIKKTQNEHIDVISNPKSAEKKNADIRNYFHRKNTGINLDLASQKESKSKVSEKKPASPSQVDSEISYNDDADDKSDDDEKQSDEDNEESSIFKKGKEEVNAKFTEDDLKEMPNLAFYLNKLVSEPRGDFIDNMHKFWKRDYEKLERHHGYVQWLFPNYYGSKFNNFAHKLTRKEAKIFRENNKVIFLELLCITAAAAQIARRLVKSYELILGFFGILLDDKQTGKLRRNSRTYKKRYQETLITSLHNHLRVQRILSHLSIVGFRAYAVEFVKYLEIEMFGFEGGYQVYQANKANPTDKKYFEELKNNPLFPIVKYNVFNDWKVYGETHNDYDLQALYVNCMSDDPEDYKASVYFERFNKKKNTSIAPKSPKK